MTEPSYVPGTEEKDPQKVIMALQSAASNISEAQAAIDTNTSNIATNTATIAANMATNTAAIAANAAAILALIPAGTLMLFQQTSAPTGWTKQTTHNDKALRVVSGTASSGGSNSFSTVMAQTVVGGTALTIAQMPAHVHGTVISSSTGSSTSAGVITNGTADTSLPTTSNGSGSTHNHTITMSMQYVDIIIASKN